jgi:CubicO group peptidase (beta-lactamase class C family)
MDEFNVPGMAVAIVKDGHVLAIETFGRRAPGGAGGAQGAAPTPETIYYIASITKTSRHGGVRAGGRWQAEP